MSRLLYSPPPYYSIAATATVNQQRSPSSSSSSVSSSIMIVIIIIASAIIVSASVYLLLRFLSRRFQRSFRTTSPTDADVLHSSVNTFNEVQNRLPPNNLLDSLPVFKFSSVNGNLSGGDCAVCLSKFEVNDELRLLPLCCHAFHATCVDTWLTTNETCPLCRSIIHATDDDVLNKIIISSGGNLSNSFRVEIGSVSQRRPELESTNSDDRPISYSIGSFEYIVDDGYEVSIGSTHRRRVSECPSVDKESVEIPANSLATEVGGGGSWRDYLSRSFRSSGRFFSGSSRRSDAVVAIEETEPNRIGEEISELFRWLSGI